MKSIRVAVAAKSFQKNKNLMHYLEVSLAKLPFDFDIMKVSDLSEAVDARALVLGKQTLSASELEKMPHLKVVSKYGVGMDNLSFKDIEQSGVELLHAPGVNALYVAEHTLGLILGSLRNINQSHQQLSEGIWKKDGGVSLFKKKVLIIGLGAVGLATANLLKGFQCEIGYCDIRDRTAEASKEYQVFNLQEGLKWCDVATLHVSKNPTSLHLISQPELDLLSGKLLVNTSRGGVIRQADLLQALKLQKLRAALDVFDLEPLQKDHPYRGLNNVVLTPHTAANSLESQWAMGTATVNLLCGWFQGKQL